MMSTFQRRRRNLSSVGETKTTKRAAVRGASILLGVVGLGAKAPGFRDYGRFVKILHIWGVGAHASLIQSATKMAFLSLKFSFASQISPDII